LVPAMLLTILATWSKEGQAMRLPRVRFTLRSVMIAVGFVAVLLAMEPVLFLSSGVSPGSRYFTTVGRTLP
jgi:hypothetical protein